MRRQSFNIRHSALTILLPLVFLVAAGYSARALREERLFAANPDMRFPSSAPMVEFVNVALGGFRGLAADMLWLRAGRLQEERRFVELAQLADWITKLEPRLSEVWVFHAWNMAYNISVLMTRPEDRWLWIQNGIELLRDNALPLNPRDATIQRELGWIFQHKIAMDSDRHSAWFRTRWAVEIDAYLDSGGAIPGDDEFIASELRERFRLEPELMREIEARFGRIDWRVPSAHSLYWAWRGLPSATDVERLPSRRMIYTSLITMSVGHGLLVGDPSAEDFQFAARPNLALIEPAADFIEETMELHDFGGIRFAYVGLLRDGMILLARAGAGERSRALHGRLAAFFGAGKFPPYEQTLNATDDLYRGLLNEMGYR